MHLQLFIHNRFGYCWILVTLVSIKKSFTRQNSCVVRKQEYVGLHDTEAALSEIYFYHIKEHLLPESMFNIEQLKFFLSSLLLLPSVLTHHWSISWIHFSGLFCRPCFPGALLYSHGFWNISVAVLVWEQGPSGSHGQIQPSAWSSILFWGTFLV